MMTEEFGLELSPTWKIAVRVWWAITWRGFLLSMFPVFLLTIPVSVVFLMLERSAGVSPTVTGAMSQGVGMLIGFCVQVYVIKMILSKKFSDFRITILTREPGAHSAEASSERKTSAA